VALLDLLVGARARQPRGPADDPEEDDPLRVPLGCPPLDALLGGGVESAALTEFYGEAGTGKTNACLQLARNVARAGRKVVYIDTEGVSLERLAQMCAAEGDFEQVRKSILFFEPFTLDEQEKVIDKACRLALGNADIGVLLLDSATVFYRVGLADGEEVRDRRHLTQQLHQLLAVARQKGIPVVITNQVYTNLENNVFEPIGGQMLRHLSKAVVRLEKAGVGRRRGTIMKHRSIPEGSSAEFAIGESGLGPLAAELPPGRPA